MLDQKLKIPLIVNLIAVLIFSIIFFTKQNFEFIFYIGVIIFFMLLILFTHKKVTYPLSVIWGLTLWSIMHMAGGGLMIGGTRLYELMILPLVGEPYLIFKYDQLVHIIGFGVATLLMYELIKPSLKDHKRFISLAIVVVMAGLGVGALNEIIEFIAATFMANNGVGGYVNTSLDLIADLIGGLIALVYIKKTATE